MQCWWETMKRSSVRVLLRYEITRNVFLNYTVRCASVEVFTDKKELPEVNRSL